MSKITKALEKAARERLLHQQERVTVLANSPVTVPVLEPGTGDVSSVTRVELDPHIVSATDPTSPVSEQYRIMRTNLQSQSLWGRPGSKVIVVTSAVHGEGKSVTALNLALTCARQEHFKVVLVDGDLRKSSIRRWLGLTEHPEGLSTRLLDGGPLNGALVRLKEPPLTILPAGQPVDHPAELLESSTMKRLLAILKSQFDLIIIDTPPLLPIADPAVLAAQADGVLLVVKAGKTQRPTVERAQHVLQQAKAPLMGCVLTHVEYYLPGYYRYYHSYRSPGSTVKDAPPTATENDAGAPVTPEVAATGREREAAG